MLVHFCLLSGHNYQSYARVFKDITCTSASTLALILSLAPFSRILMIFKLLCAYMNRQKRWDPRDWLHKGYYIFVCSSGQASLDHLLHPHLCISWGPSPGIWSVVFWGNFYNSIHLSMPCLRCFYGCTEFFVLLRSFRCEFAEPFKFFPMLLLMPVSGGNLSVSWGCSPRCFQSSTAFCL